MTRYGVRKKSSNTNRSYTGPSWQLAGLQQEPQTSFRSEASAKFVAGRLSEVNPVGFEVFEIEDTDD